VADTTDLISQKEIPVQDNSKILDCGR